MTWGPRSALALAAAVLCPALATAAVYLRRRYYRVEVAGRSMHPALQPGDYLIVRLGAPTPRDAAFGWIVTLPDQSGRLLLKRVVGLPGESLRVGSAVQVNGRVLIEPYAHGMTSPSQYRGLSRLGDDEYFLLGDRRDASTDSRDFGPVRRDLIEGVAVARYWPPRRAGRLPRPRRELSGTPPPGADASGIVGAGRALTAGRAHDGVSTRGDGE